MITNKDTIICPKCNQKIFSDIYKDIYNTEINAYKKEYIEKSICICPTCSHRFKATITYELKFKKIDYEFKFKDIKINY